MGYFFFKEDLKLGGCERVGADLGGDRKGNGDNMIKIHCSAYEILRVNKNVF